MVEAIALGVALVLVPFTRGSFRQLGKLRFHGYWLLFGALGIQVALELVTLPRARVDDFGFGVLMLSYVLILGFCSANLRTTGMSVVMIGIAMNALVIGLNQGMPTKVSSPHGHEVTVKHRPERANDVLTVLDDRIVVRGPVDEAISFGDLVIAVGLVDVVYRGSRRPRRARRRGSRGAPAEPGLAEDQPDTASEMTEAPDDEAWLVAPVVAKVPAVAPAESPPADEQRDTAKSTRRSRRRERRAARAVQPQKPVLPPPAAVSTPAPTRPPVHARPPLPTPTRPAPTPSRPRRPPPTPAEIDRQFWPERAPRTSAHPSLLKVRRREEFITSEIDLTAYELPPEKYGGLRRALRPDEEQPAPVEHPLERPEDPGVIDITGP
jgi:hypothetical protein